MEVLAEEELQKKIRLCWIGIWINVICSFINAAIMGYGIHLNDNGLILLGSIVLAINFIAGVLYRLKIMELKFDNTIANELNRHKRIGELYGRD